MGFLRHPFYAGCHWNRFRMWFDGNFVIMMVKIVIDDAHSKTVIENRLRMFCIMKFMPIFIK